MTGSSQAPRGGKSRSACDLCRQKKIRCDQAKPACETCHLACVPCTFTAPSPLPRRSTREQLADARSKIRELESVLAARTDLQRSYHSSQPQTPFSHLRDTYDLDTALTTFQWHVGHCGLGPAHSSQRRSFSSAVYQQTGSAFDLDILLYQVAQSFKSQHSEPARDPIAAEWPPTPLIQHCLEHYADAGLYSFFPVVDTKALQSYLATNVDRSTAPTPTADWACLVAFTALITELHRLDPAFANATPDNYLEAVLAMLPRLLIGDANLRTLETVIIIMIYVFPLGRAQSAGFLLAIAVRILYNLGGNRDSITSEPYGKHLRALFWICYLFDKDLSVRYSQPPLMKDVDCDLTLPNNYVTSDSDNQFLLRPLSSHELLFHSDIRLAFTKSKIYNLLYSDYGKGQSEARRLQYIRELDLELSNLKSSFPPNCQPDTFATEGAPNYMFHDLSLRGVNLHLEYYYCLGKVHEASSACSMSRVNSWSLLPLPSSAELYCQESRITLQYICHIRHFLTWHTFWIHAQFLLTAVLSLFRHLISFPTAPSFSADLHLMERMMEIFTNLDRDSMRTRRFPSFFITECFIRRLISLANQARSNATER